MSCNKESSLVALILNPHATGEEAQLPCHKVLTSLQSAVDQILTSGQFGPVGFPVRAVSGIQQKNEEHWTKQRQVTPSCLTIWCHAPLTSIIFFQIEMAHDEVLSNTKSLFDNQQHCVCPTASRVGVRNVID